MLRGLRCTESKLSSCTSTGTATNAAPCLDNALRQARPMTFYTWAALMKRAV